MDIGGFVDNNCLVNEEPFFSEYGSSAYFVRKSWLDSLTPYTLSDEELQSMFDDMQADEEIDRRKSDYYDCY